MTRSRFLLMAHLVQGGVLLFAIAVGYGIGVPVTTLMRWDSLDLMWGILAVLPMLAIYQFSPGLRRLALESMGEFLSLCRWYELVYLAALAGIGEELLFRGVLYEGLVPFHPWVAVIVSNVAFGLLHGLSWNYFWTTTAIGFGMHGLAEIPEQRNLLVPIVAHSVYDYIAFQLLLCEQRPLRTP